VAAEIRNSYCPENRNAPELAHRLQEEGIAAVAVHGRTRACRFEGEAEHDTVAAIKARLGIPVFANGDIRTPAAARAVLARTGVDGVMIGRAALGAPWLLGMIADPARREPGLAEKWRVIREHVAAMHDFYGPDRGLKVARKHVQWYLEALGCDPGAADAPGRAFNRIADPAEQLDWLAARAAVARGGLEAAA